MINFTVAERYDAVKPVFAEHRVKPAEQNRFIIPIDIVFVVVIIIYYIKKYRYVLGDDCAKQLDKR
jgi:hypothetical protein